MDKNEKKAKKVKVINVIKIGICVLILIFKWSSIQNATGNLATGYFYFWNTLYCQKCGKSYVKHLATITEVILFK